MLDFSKIDMSDTENHFIANKMNKNDNSWEIFYNILYLFGKLFFFY